MFFGAIKLRGEEDEGEKEATAEAVKSSSPEAFLKTPEAKEFIKTWTGKEKDGKPMYTKRGIVALLRNIFQIPGLGSNKAVVKETHSLLILLGGEDKLQGFLAGWKAKSEGIIKGIKSLLKG